MKKIIFKIVFIIICIISSFTMLGANRRMEVVFTNYNAKISTEKAKEIIFEHARIDRAKVRITKLTLSKENKKYFYDIDFFTEEHKYNYNVDADTGNILKQNRSIRKRTLKVEKRKTLWELLGL